MLYVSFCFLGNSDKTPYMFAALPAELLPASPQGVDGIRTHDQALIAVEVFVTRGGSPPLSRHERLRVSGITGELKQDSLFSALPQSNAQPILSGICGVGEGFEPSISV